MAKALSFVAWNGGSCISRPASLSSSSGFKVGRGERPVVVSRGKGAEEAASEESGDSLSPSGPRLVSILKNKQRVLQAQLSTLQDGKLEQRLTSLQPYASPYRLLETIAGQLMQGKTAIVAEVARLSPSESLESLATRCQQYVQWGADALAICTDEEKSPNGAVDLAAACKAVKVPVLRKDWIIHPLQVAETREAGAAAILAVYSILTKGTPSILQYAVSLGLDAIVEVVNLQELQEVSPIGVPLYGFNLSVGLSLSLPGLRKDIAKSLVGEIPFGATSLVGVWSVEEARMMKIQGADAVYVRHEVLQGRNVTEGKSLDPKKFLEDMRDTLTGDD